MVENICAVEPLDYGALGKSNMGQIIHKTQDDGTGIIYFQAKVLKNLFADINLLYFPPSCPSSHITTCPEIIWHLFSLVLSALIFLQNFTLLDLKQKSVSELPIVSVFQNTHHPSFRFEYISFSTSILKCTCCLQLLFPAAPFSLLYFLHDCSS